MPPPAPSPSPSLQCCIADMHETPAGDALSLCMLEKARCIPLPPTPTYPQCKDAEIAGDPNFQLEHLQGHWYKVGAWKKGEPIECQKCQNVTLILDEEKVMLSVSLLLIGRLLSLQLSGPPPGDVQILLGTERLLQHHKAVKCCSHYGPRSCPGDRKAI